MNTKTETQFSAIQQLMQMQTAVDALFTAIYNARDVIERTVKPAQYDLNIEPTHKVLMEAYALAKEVDRLIGSMTTEIISDYEITGKDLALQLIEQSKSETDMTKHTYEISALARDDETTE